MRRVTFRADGVCSVILSGGCQPQSKDLPAVGMQATMPAGGRKVCLRLSRRLGFRLRSFLTSLRMTEIFQSRPIAGGAGTP